MKYTISKLADKKVEQDLNIIKKIIIKKLNPISIILFGGFGRGEGSFLIKNKKIIPLNDYDLYIITKNKISDKILEKIGLECSKAIGKGGLEFVEHSNEKYDINKFFHVDIRCLTYNELNKLLPTQRTAELKNSMVVYGKNLLNKISKVEVPVSDAIRLLFNKMDHLLLAEKNDKKIKLIYSIKAFIDCCTALLIFEKKFKPTYKERNEIFQKINFPFELKKKVDWATTVFKLKPMNFDIQNIDQLWKEAKYWVEFTFKYIITRYLKIKSENWKDIAKAIYKKLPYIYFSPYLKSSILFPLQYYLTIKWVFKTKEFRALLNWRDVGIRLAIPLMLYLYNEKEEAKKYLSKITSKTEPLRQRILDLYATYYLQKLI